MTKTLVFFSTVFPYETTLKNEFECLAVKFEKIYYFPTSREAGDSFLPSNVVLMSELFEKQKPSNIKLLFRYFPIAITVFLVQALKRGAIGSYIKHVKTYLSILLTSLWRAGLIKKSLSKEVLQSALFYDYWFENATLSLALLKRKGVINKFISRAHRFDLYDVGDRIVPFREFKLKYIDRVYAISEHGKKYMQSKTSKYSKKVCLHYLGSANHSNLSPANEGISPLIVSCSNMREFKRVHLIPRVLKIINRPIRWVHFGDGEMMPCLIKEIELLPEHIKAEIMGNRPNAEIFNFFSQQSVSFFISLSESEGLPISMMEAISFGVPVFAMRTCGIPELVNEKTGVLFEQNDSIEGIAAKLEMALFEFEFSKEIIKEFHTNNFDAKRNVSLFAKEISQAF